MQRKGLLAIRSAPVRALTLAAAAAILLVVAAGEPAQADHSWNGYHWAGDARPLRIVYLDSLAPGFRKQRVTGPALEGWELDDLVHLERARSDDSRRMRRSCPPVTGAIRICNADYGSEWFGHTELLIEGQRVTGGRIRINDHWGTNASFRRFVVCHEVGHSLGLWHRSSGTSCLSGGRNPDGHDLSMLRKIIETAAAADGEDPGTPECVDGLICVVGGLAGGDRVVRNHDRAHPQLFVSPLFWSGLIPF